MGWLFRAWVLGSLSLGGTVSLCAGMLELFIDEEWYGVILSIWALGQLALWVGMIRPMWLVQQVALRMGCWVLALIGGVFTVQCLSGGQGLLSIWPLSVVINVSLLLWVMRRYSVSIHLAASVA